MGWPRLQRLVDRLSTTVRTKAGSNEFKQLSNDSKTGTPQGPSVEYVHVGRPGEAVPSIATADSQSYGLPSPLRRPSATNGSSFCKTPCPPSPFRPVAPSLAASAAHRSVRRSTTTSTLPSGLAFLQPLQEAVPVHGGWQGSAAASFQQVMLSSSASSMARLAPPSPGRYGNRDGRTKHLSMHDSCGSVGTNAPSLGKEKSLDLPRATANMNWASNSHLASSCRSASTRFWDAQEDASESSDELVSTLQTQSLSATENIQRKPSRLTEPELVVSSTVVGKGSYGVVQKGTFMGMEVAVKTTRMDESQLRDPTLTAIRTTAELESHLLSRLDHPNVVKTYCCLQKETSSLWEQRLVQELCDADVARLLSLKLIDVPEPNLRLQCIVQLARDIAAGLAYCHSQGVIHGDVNPRNVLIILKAEALPLGCVAKIADFGLSKLLRPGQAFVPGVRHGTPFYVSPEVAEQGLLYPASDIYSFGVMLWELVSGKTPFARKEKGSTELIWREGFPNKVPEECPPTLKHLIACCLALRPQDRPSWNVILAVLTQLAVQLEAAAPCDPL